MSKNRIAFGVSVIDVAAAVGTIVRAQTGEKSKPGAPAAKHVAVNNDELKFGPAPAGLPAGAQMAVVDGDPSKAGVPFVIRAKFPDGYRVPPHFHPADENIVVLSGSLAVGMGDTFDEASMKVLSSGGFAHMPKAMHHYALAKADTEIQVHGVGPFAITYVNPKDDPRKKTTTAAK